MPSALFLPFREFGIWRRLSHVMALACALVSVVVFVRRGLAAGDAAAIPPGVAVTSGCEEESFFAIWRAVHGQPVYVDATRLPFGGAYFNWLFYAGYAAPVRIAVSKDGDEVIPRAGRLITAIGAVAGIGGLFWLLRRVSPGRWPVALGLAAFVFFGPLVGWWTHTLRPDVWAVVCETAALALLLLLYRTRPLAAALLSCLLFYAAWSFKQTYFLGLGGAGCFLLVRRQWRTVAILGAGSIALWCLTFLLLGPDFRASFRTTGATNVFYLATGLGNLRDFFQKTSPLWLLAAGLTVAARRTDSVGKTPLAGDVRLLGLLGLLVALPLSFVASCKLGAASYYYFTPLVMLALLVGGLIATRERAGLVLFGFTAAVAMQLLVMVGRVGQISLQPQAREMAATWAAWQAEPAPRFAAVNSFNEPWLNPGSPPLVLAYNYGLDRAAGRPFETGGVGGMISAGYFRSLLLPADTREEYDGGTLRQYVRGPTVNGYTVFRRVEPLAR